MQDPIAPIQDSDYIILFQPVLVPRNAIQSLSMMPISQPMQLPQPISVQQIQQEDAPALLPPPTSNATTDEKSRKWEASEKQMEWVHNIARQRGMTDAEVCQVTGVPSLDRLSKAQASSFINDYKGCKQQF